MCSPMDQDIEVAAGSNASLYRTRWLAAHNRLHAIVHEGEVVKPIFSQQWNEYLAELAASDEIASTRA
jgi:Zn-dependent peptidase ImmA (M78 family)